MNYKIGVVGLGVMGRNLALNMERNGFPVAGYDLDAQKTNAWLAESTGKAVLGAKTPDELMAALEEPRRLLLMVPAGAAVDSAIAHLLPYLKPSDIVIDGGNSHFMDTERRVKEFEARGMRFVGAGISGGEEGAKWGPAIMPGGSPESWLALAPIFTAIAAKAEDGQPCVTYIGPSGAGHYVKMVHNGIEYGDMQLIAEAYDLLHRGLGLDAPTLSRIFSTWNEGRLKSYLIEITANIFKKVDGETGLPVVDLILDEAQQKGTGKWTSQNALDIGAPIPTINAGLVSRIISAVKSERVAAAKILSGPIPKIEGDPAAFIDAVENALYASKITSYAQGLAMMKMASIEYGYELNLCEIAKIWRAGCVIRASLLGDIMAAYERNPRLVNLMLDPFFHQALDVCQADWRRVIQAAVGMGIPVPAMCESLAYYDAYRSERLPANLTQAQRDYFGAHTYRRMDRDGVFHTQWEQGK